MRNEYLKKESSTHIINSQVKTGALLPTVRGFVKERCPLYTVFDSHLESQCWEKTHCDERLCMMLYAQNKFTEGKNNKETLLKANTQVWMEV